MPSPRLPAISTTSCVRRAADDERVHEQAAAATYAGEPTRTATTISAEARRWPRRWLTTGGVRVSSIAPQIGTLHRRRSCRAESLLLLGHVRPTVMHWVRRSQSAWRSATCPVSAGSGVVRRRPVRRAGQPRVDARARTPGAAVRRVRATRRRGDLRRQQRRSARSSSRTLSEGARPCRSRPPRTYDGFGKLALVDVQAPATAVIADELIQRLGVAADA